MKRSVLLLFAALMTAVAGMAQPPHGGHHQDRRGEHRREYVECATSEQLHMSLQAIENQSFDDKKLEIAKLCVTLGRFYTDDLSRMARKFSFDANRKKFLTYAYRYCTDPQNYYSLRDAFEFRSNFDEMMDDLQGKRR